MKAFVYKTKTLRLREDFILSLLEAKIDSLKRLKKESLEQNQLVDLVFQLIQNNQKPLKYLLNKSWVTGIHKEIYLNHIKALKRRKL